MIEGIDYYLEGGKYVFTAHFLKSREYCCTCGCRHCPYGEVKTEESLQNNQNSDNKDCEKNQLTSD